LPASWRPSASFDRLRLRARLLAEARAFFAERGVLEVETPLLAATTVTDPHLHSFEVRDHEGRGCGYLQTSPELAMKRLLAAGSGSIFQLGRVFRSGERGRLHLPEFTMLEWYRIGYDHHALMDEVEALLRRLLAPLLGTAPAERTTYRGLFGRSLDVDPLACADSELQERAAGLAPGSRLDRDELLALLLTHRVEPTFEPGRLFFVHDFPASQAALARLRRDPDGVMVAERFEVYVGPIELANGFHELGDAAEQRRRFERDLGSRRSLGLAQPSVDERLLAALEHGLPDCAGVALGFDRLVMLAAGATSAAEVAAFAPEPTDASP
jgi:lysyl-tRNA synthetase class 2